MTRATNAVVVIATCAALTGCSDAGRGQGMYSSTDKPLGRWPAEKPRAVKPPDTEPEAGKSATALGDASVPDTDDSDSGTAEAPPTAGTGSVKPPNNGGGQTPAAHAGDATKLRLRFNVLTHIQHMRLSLTDPAFDEDSRGPKNMGAIWISKPDGTFVRSIEVWRLHKERARHLVGYNKVCACPKPDVTATATLSKHKEHVATWDLTDRDGKQVPEGNYTLHLEVADYDVDNPMKLDTKAVNAEWKVDFDTRTAPKTEMPGDEPYFSNLKLELFAP